MQTEIDEFLVLLLTQMIDEGLFSHILEEKYFCREFGSLLICSESIFRETVVEHIDD
jgi:hypothetical protein